MDVVEAIKTRRCIRKYKSNPVPASMINIVLEAAIWAPSASNHQPCRYIVILDKNLIEEIGEIGVETAVKRLAPEKEKYAKDLVSFFPETDEERKSPNTVKKYVEMIKKGTIQSYVATAPALIAVCVDVEKSPTYWSFDAAASIQNMLLAAHSLGLGACWITNPVSLPLKVKKKSVNY